MSSRQRGYVGKVFLASLSRLRYGLRRTCRYRRRDSNGRKPQELHATATPDEIERFRLERGDVLITKDSETWDDIGVPALVSDSAPDLISGFHLAFSVPVPNVSSVVICTERWRARESHASFMFTLRFLSRDTGFVDEAIGRTERLIHGVREYRARLINDVVTGRADVHATLASRPDRTPVEEFEFE